jgi:hypothetical protein
MIGQCGPGFGLQGAHGASTSYYSLCVLTQRHRATRGPSKPTSTNSPSTWPCRCHSTCGMVLATYCRTTGIWKSFGGTLGHITSINKAPFDMPGSMLGSVVVLMVVIMLPMWVVPIGRGTAAATASVTM